VKRAKSARCHPYRERERWTRPHSNS